MVNAENNGEGDQELKPPTCMQSFCSCFECLDCCNVCGYFGVCGKKKEIGCGMMACLRDFWSSKLRCKAMIIMAGGLMSTAICITFAVIYFNMWELSTPIEGEDETYLCILPDDPGYNHA